MEKKTGSKTIIEGSVLKVPRKEHTVALTMQAKERKQEQVAYQMRPDNICNFMAFFQDQNKEYSCKSIHFCREFDLTALKGHG